jgi:hypothetical protein
MATAATRGSIPASRISFERLRWFNGLMAILHAAQGVAILLLSDDVRVPITTTFLVYDEQLGRLVPETNTVYELPLAPLIASFVFISAVAHVLLAGPLYGWYIANLKRGANYLRWWEYALSASVMIALIAILPGMWDLPSLLLIFALNAMMLFCGLMMEQQNRPGQPVNWTPFWFGCFAGAIPWVVIALYLFSPGAGGGDPPGFVFAVFFSLFAFYNAFAANMWLQYRRVGPWRDYLFGELVYVILSLTAKSALAWQVFFGTLGAPID